jgi:hypothetical protein
MVAMWTFAIKNLEMGRSSVIADLQKFDTTQPQIHGFKMSV